MKASKAYKHPNWTGRNEEGYDVALIVLPRLVKNPWGYPVWAKPGHPISPNDIVFGFKHGPFLQVAGSKLINSTLCTQMKEIGSNTICAYSQWAPMAPSKLKFTAPWDNAIIFAALGTAKLVLCTWDMPYCQWHGAKNSLLTNVEGMRWRHVL